MENGGWKMEKGKSGEACSRVECEGAAMRGGRNAVRGKIKIRIMKAEESVAGNVRLPVLVGRGKILMVGTDVIDSQATHFRMRGTRRASVGVEIGP
jgi:hypothetical protein